MNSPVFVLKLYGAGVVGRVTYPVESNKVYECKLQYVGLFWISDSVWALNTENGVVNEFKL